MNVQDIYYHGVRDQIRRVLNAMSPDQIDKGMTAFNNGHSDWSHCFFGRAIPGTNQAAVPEKFLMEQLGIPTPIPIRIVYCTFDGCGRNMTRKQLRQFIEDVRDESRPQEVMAVIRGVDYSRAEESPVPASISCE